ncbi:dihydrolipoyl dehydrogenase [candidate division WOR-1 bacterium RIFOXYA12_FULL_43_27]|uniref:Dihydrolipoyl dehydrogenase n=1 Tax=candidate division WOR-1 bacterium RIFOXYC2_FULL_46_14 TaxID=1802587 RepID=A0A1F4U820_UNCSA|nr:MAG: dihydrolipoyl dehydrogenase [candidate division WOR-1 bacterium RIFOXYA12_FULL_43_27]OGC19452.1 MAG: dihydrolipoyl dehydrogenase [candidate division WOR-1 bacterium RIFOXYB2_FULL_46_45]OGC30441.1 MAG: dihydrolipoyl dehydrogenase [candidate division WOR-1 bacterium RIFOXYA2_FULL_46_56]OGC41041.1 MAG: dihydrolipoyl dehydrogenase [candidate division WOR-1 bacterium RIFOXYC2_FULL_46_14]
MPHYDVVVIGAGPGGYVAAIRAAQLGGKVLLIEKDQLGGTCLNHGCIPTKALITSTNFFDDLGRAGLLGIEISDPKIDFQKVMARKERVVNKLRKGIEFLLKKNNVEVIYGEGTLLEDGGVEVKRVDSSKERVESRKIILATGSYPIALPNVPFDGKKFISSNDLLSWKDEIPKKLNIVGGGVIGVHFASIYSSLGSEITIFEAQPDILPGFDHDLVDAVRSILKRKKVTVLTNTNFKPEEAKGTTLISIGRKPNAKVTVNEKMETETKNVYAIGDVTGISMLAHVASAQGIVAAENAMGKDSKMDYNAIPCTIYTHPEIGTIGLTEEAARAKHEISIGRFPFSALGHANAIGETEGFFKIIAEKKSGKILGVHIVGAQASSVLGIASLAMANNLTVEQLARTIFAHPSIPEGLFEAGLNTLGIGIHS